MESYLLKQGPAANASFAGLYPAGLQAADGTLSPPSQLKALGWGQRALSLADFYEASLTHCVFVREVPALPSQGVFYYRGQRPVILLNARLPERQRTLAAWHEFGHFLLHVPGQVVSLMQAELEADLIAWGALLPRAICEALPARVIADRFNYPLKLVRRRLRALHCFNL